MWQVFQPVSLLTTLACCVISAAAGVQQLVLCLLSAVFSTSAGPHPLLQMAVQVEPTSSPLQLDGQTAKKLLGISGS
jgi:hypothetical protein